jgi:ubiquitin-like-conjugating enzyme ATG10
MSHHDEYRQWPFLTQEEFELACAFFDRKYIRAELGPRRRTFKIRHRRNATTGETFIEVLRLLSLPDNEDDLVAALAKLGEDSNTVLEMEIDEDDEVSISEQHASQTHTNPITQEVLRPDRISGVVTETKALPPQYSLHAHQPYVVYEIHLHPTYQVPTLWFSLHDLPMGEPTFDLESVYRYLVPDEFKSRLRGAGITGGLSAAVSVSHDFISCL